MKPIKSLILTVLLMLSASVMAQKTTVKGVVVSKSLGEGEPFATIRIFKTSQKEKPIDMFLTDADGRFNHEVEGSGSYDIVFSSIGKQESRQAITLGKEKVVNLDTIYLSDDAKTLSGVEVVAQKPLVKMEVDKMSYRVEDDTDAKSSTVLDMLRKVPMVSVDGQDNITVNGSASFKVYVDGKPNVMFSSNPSLVFKSMPASAVKTIEVVTNPGAKYDAEGASGVLNIVMNKLPGAAPNLDGYNGTIRATVGNKSKNGSVFLSGQKGKLTYSANVMVNYSTPGTTKVDIEQNNGASNILTSYRATTKLPFTMGNISLGYELDPMSSLNTSLSVTSLSLKNNGEYTTTMGGNGMSGNNGFSYNSDMNSKNSNTSLSWNIDYQRFLNPERNKYFVLSYQLDYTPTRTEQSNTFHAPDGITMDLTDRTSDGKDRTTDHTFQMDFTTPVIENHTFNTGVKFISRRASTDSKYYLKDVYTPGMSMDYVYNNSIAAAYGEYEAKWNNLSTKAGLRYEHTWQDVKYNLGNGENFSTNYGSLVPSASLSYSLAPTKNIGLTYNLRISRPGITYLNPYINRTDPNSLQYGNPDLDIEKSHNVSLVYNMFSQKLMLNANLRHTYTGNAIEQYSFYDNGLLNSTYGNIVKRNQTGVNVYVNWLATKDTRIFLNGGASYNDLRSKELNAYNSGWQANAMLGIQQTLPWNLKAGAFLITSTKTYTLQGWSSGFNILTANLSKSFLNDKLTVSVSGMTGLSDKGCIKMESYSSGKDFLQHQTIKVPIYGVNLSVSYTFGNAKQTRQHQSRIQNDYIEQKSQGEMINSVGNEMPM